MSDLSLITPATHARLVARDALTNGDLSGMFNVLTGHFEGVTREQFERDQAEKNWVLLIERAGHLVGFSTILAYETSFNASPLSVIFSGDTIVTPEAWNTSTLPRAWIESVAKLRELYPRGPYLWMLITSGFRTYRFLPLFWRSFFPRCDAATPPESQRLIDHLARERFGPQYNTATGIVRFNSPQRLRGKLSTIPAGRLDDPHVSFFAARNPEYVRGDEMVCLTELTPANLTVAGRRMTSAIGLW